MTAREPPESTAKTDAEVEGLLSQGLATEPFDPQRLERLHAAVAQEWRAAVAAETRSRGSRRPRARRLLWAAAASMILAVAALLWSRSMPELTVAGAIARLEQGPLEVRSGFLRHHSAIVGDSLRVGERFTTRGPVLVTLAGGGTLRIATGTTLSLKGPTQFALETGLIYLDLPPRAAASKPLLVLTQAGTIQHLGTEFEVLSDAQWVRVRVREGRVRFATTSRTLDAAAGTELRATVGGMVEERPVATYGRNWTWETALAPEFEIDGKSLTEFLTWVSRELGCRLDFMEPEARLIAARTILHGHVSGATPADVLANVLSTTSLSSELHEDDLRIRSTP